MKYVKIVMICALVFGTFCPAQADRLYYCAYRVSSVASQSCAEWSFTTASYTTTDIQLRTFCMSGPPSWLTMNPDHYRLPTANECYAQQPTYGNEIMMVYVSTMAVDVRTTERLAGKCDGVSLADACKSSPVPNPGFTCTLKSTPCGGSGTFYPTSPAGVPDTSHAWSPPNNAFSVSITTPACARNYFVGSNSPNFDTTANCQTVTQHIFTE